jgi:hypothetical protein
MSEEIHDRFPEISEKGKEQAIKLVEDFKKQVQEIANKAVGDLYCDILPHIETDAWTNFRTSILRDLCDYSNSVESPYDYKRIRESLYAEHKEAIDKDLNQDLLNQIEQLQKDLQRSYNRY